MVLHRSHLDWRFTSNEWNVRFTVGVKRLSLWKMTCYSTPSGSILTINLFIKMNFHSFWMKLYSKKFRKYNKSLFNFLYVLLQLFSSPAILQINLSKTTTYACMEWETRPNSTEPTDCSHRRNHAYPYYLYYPYKNHKMSLQLHTHNVTYCQQCYSI